MSDASGITKIELPDKQVVDLPDEVADRDETLKDALEMYVPEIKNAKITRFKQGDQKWARITKQAGTKGLNPVLESLIAADEQLNPAVDLHIRMMEQEQRKKLDVKSLLLLSGAIDKAVDLGEKEAETTKRALRHLKDSRAVASKTVPRGF